MLDWLVSLDKFLGKLSEEDRKKIFDRFVHLISKYRNGEYNLIYGQTLEETEKKCCELEELEVIISYYRDPFIAKMIDDFLRVNLIMIPMIKEKGVKALTTPEFI